MPLASAFAKFEHGVKHLTALRLASDAYRRSKPFREVRDRDPATNEHRTYAVGTAPPPTDIALLAGDAVHNLRSALDHAVFGLSEAQLGRPLTVQEQRGPEFPILDDEAQWPNAVLRKLKWLSPDTVAVLRDFQPFRFRGPSDEPDAAKYDPLNVLAELDNTDKHRVIPVVIGFTQVSGVSISDRARGKHRFTHPIVEDGSYVSRLPADLDPSSDAHPMWDVHLTVRIPGWPEIEDIDAMLEVVARRVDYVLGRLRLVIAG